MPGITAFPPFPDNVPTHPLLVIDYELIKAYDKDEIAQLWKAATELGFWYLENHGVDEEVHKMFDVGAETMDLPFQEKMEFEQGDNGFSFGYKASGATVTDENGSPDSVEFINIAKDDAFAWPAVARRTYPSTVNARMDDAVVSFIKKSVEVNDTLLEVFNELLGLPEGTLASKHKLNELSGSEARVIKSPPRPGGMDEAKAALMAHTDFGSLSFLHNRLGGLQVMVPGTDKWQYVKPIAGHAICNIGDALTIFSGGLLKSNLHRVVPPPGEQAYHTRWSVVYFTRPGNSVQLRALGEQSPVIGRAVENAPTHLRAIFETGQTSLEWFTRRMKNMRTNNHKGADVWRAQRGTEHHPLVV
ncbi:Clavaminate synthase-like protein [Dichomitus squalens]|uniref:Clavaminate synthase-like protein n=1 Tax=Dichomitus squalens TaxID=114155 RepID=A0A4Q9PR48_9APHY|nr:Clavaminate synthase-like protein [Dichomitus squalens]TBU56854.1 Clavaminate synthase-like protein [Dichomitus squalens]